MNTNTKWLMLTLMLIATLLLIVLLPGCAPHPLSVLPAQPLPPARPVVPTFLQSCPQIPSWYPPETCKHAPTQ